MRVADRSIVAAILCASLFGFTPKPSEAQLSITPDGTSGGTIAPSTNNYTATFDVYPYAFWQYCWGTNGITCSVASTGSGTVQVTFHTSSATGAAEVGLGGTAYDPPECDPDWMECNYVWDTGYITYNIVAPNDPPVAGFTFLPSAPNAKQPVSFTNTSTDDGGIVSHAWSFGDGVGTSTSASPSYTYASGGQRTVTLIVTDAFGKADTAQQNLSVNHAPTASFNWTPTQPNEGATVSFNASNSSDTSPGSISSYQWTFGDSQSGTGATPNHAYSAGGQQYQVRLIVTDNGGAKDTLQQNITVNSLASPWLSVVDANPGLELNRSDCVNVAVPIGSVVCDDFAYAYGFTPVFVLNRWRQLALTYNSAAAAQSAIVGVNVSIPPGQTKPDSVCVEVDIGSTSPELCYGQALYQQDQWTRFAVPLGHAAPNDDAQLMDYNVTVTSRYTTAADQDTTISGRLVALHGQRVFGRGWWLGGYERLAIGGGPYGSHLIWIGGDQSYRVYKETTTNSGVFVSQGRARPDTIVEVGGTEYQRRLIGGGTVHFNSEGIHLRTVDRLGYETQFTHRTIANEMRPDSIKFEIPSGGTSHIPGYLLQYNATTGALEHIKVRNTAAAVGWNTFDIATSASGSGYVINSITAPDGKVTTFGASGGVITSLTEPGGRRLDVAYGGDDGKVSSTALSHSSVADTIRHTFRAASAVGADTTVVGAPHADSPTLRDSVAVWLDGPRPVAVGDTARFFTTGWGAPRGIRDAWGATTWIQRTHQTYAALPTSVQYPNGWTVTATYHSNGLLNQVTDQSTSAVTTYKWNEKWSRPDSIISPRGILTRFQYNTTTGNLEWQAVHQDTVRYTYGSNLLVSSVVDPEKDTTRFKYDSYGNLELDSLPTSTGGWTRYKRDGRGYVVLTRTATGLIGSAATQVRDTTIFDVMGRVTQTRRTNTADAMWLRTTHTYSGTTGYKTQTQAWGGATVSDSATTGATSWLYDGLGRVIREQRALGRDSMAYDLAGNIVTKYLKSANDPPITIAMTYDALNRLSQRSIPSRTDNAYSINGVDFPYYGTKGLSVSGSTVTIFGDTEAFAFDSLSGAMIRADNRYARIRRSYYPNGTLKADTLRLRNYADSTVWSTHVYGVQHLYNKDGQDSVLVHPAALSGGSDKTTFAYNSQTGRMMSLTDALGTTYSFSYDKNGQPTEIDFPGGETTYGYDAAGRIVSLNGFGFGRDRAGRIALGSYNGFGHLIGSDLNIGGEYVVETFERDAFGNPTLTSIHGQGGPHNTTVHQYSQFGRAAGASYNVWDSDAHPSTPTNWDASGSSWGRDGRGNQTAYSDIQWTWEPVGQLDPWDEVRRTSTRTETTASLFDAAERLVVFQAHRDSVFHPEQGPDQQGWKWGTFEEYWYDALGRRVLRRIQEESPICSHPDRCGADAFERYVWSGDQLLWEVQSSSADGAYTGDIGYVHGGGLDQPLGMMRNDVSIILHRDWRGLYDGATNTSGVVQFTDVPWPSGSWRVGGTSMDPRKNHTWVGSLAMGYSDQSGLQYRRNRYYDPSSGQFTQQDPIGIAGGLNLYGYANGDPINFSDPFGLCPEGNGAERAPVSINEDADCRSFWHKLGESLHGWGVRDRLASPAWSKSIADVSEATGVDASLIRAIIYEEQTHLTPFEGVLEQLGKGQTVGLGQITVGLYGVDGFSRRQLLDPGTNIRAIGMHLADLTAAGLIDPRRPVASLATKYNCGSCTQISPYGARVEQYVNQYFR